MRMLISVELVVEVEEKVVGLARQTAGVGQGETGGHQEVVNSFRVDLPSDRVVVAGRKSVEEDGSLVGGGPCTTKDSNIKGRVGSSQVVKG